jgi:glycosyltransferase involved in cell wall biosynthesis
MHSITMAITTFNRASQFSRTLQRLSQLTKPDEIIVIDDGSWDTTSDVVEHAKAHWGLNINYMYRHFPTYDSCCIARNIALKAATGDYFMTCEPEVLFVTDVVAEFKKTIEEVPNNIVTQKIIYFTNPKTPHHDDIVNNPQRLLNEFWDVRTRNQHGVDDFPQSTVVRDFVVSPFTGIYKKEWLMDIGGWDEDFSLLNGGAGYGWEDIDLITRLRIKGHNQQMIGEIIHQWHDRPPGHKANGQVLSEDIIKRKKLNIDNYEDPNNPELIANKNREWGVLKCSNKQHEFCATGLHCHTCEPEKAGVNHGCVWGQRLL